MKYFFFTSDGYTTDEMDFVWHTHKQPLRIKDTLMLPEFAITGHAAVSCSASYYTGKINYVKTNVKYSKWYVPPPEHTDNNN